MSELVKVPLEEANFKQLKYYVEAVMNLDVARGSNGAGLRSKIQQAKPDLTEIMVPAGLGDSDEKPAAQSAPAEVAASDATPFPVGQGFMHSRHDPKVELMILPSSDPMRAKDSQIACQGETIIIKRGVRVKIPYRHYLVIDQGTEQVARDTDEINPLTGLPIKEWVDQHSYPYQVYAMPSPEEIAAWDARMSGARLA